MSLYEPSAIASWMSSVLLVDDTLLSLLPGGVHETDVSEQDEAPRIPGNAAARVETPYLVYASLASPSDTQGAGGTILVADLDYAVQVLYRPGQTTEARAALARVQTLLEGVEVDIAEAEGVDAHAITARGRGVLPRTSMRELQGRLLYSEGRRWRFRVQRI